MLAFMYLSLYTGVIPNLSLKYLNAPLLLYGSFCDNTFLLIYWLLKIKTFYSIFISCKEKKSKKVLFWFFLHHDIFLVFF